MTEQDNHIGLLGLLVIFLMFLCMVTGFFNSRKQSRVISELEQEVQTLKEIKGLTSNPKLITPEPNEPIEIGKVGNRTFFLANLDGRECVSVIGLNMGSYVICGNEQGK